MENSNHDSVSSFKRTYFFSCLKLEKNAGSCPTFQAFPAQDNTSRYISPTRDVHFSSICYFFQFKTLYGMEAKEKVFFY